MKTSIEVHSLREADAVKAALADPETRVVVDVVGALLPLDPIARSRVLSYVRQRLDAENGQPKG